MGYIRNTSVIKWTDTSSLENEINNNFSNNIDIDIHDIVIFAKITPYSYYPIQTSITDKNMIKIKDSTDYIGLELFVGSKHQYLHKSLKLNSNSYKIELDEYFKTAWNPSKFIIFQNGYLMNHELFSYIIPSFNNTYLRKVIYSTAMFKKNTKIDIYYIESDDFATVPISRDLYLGAVKYIAKKNNDQIIPIPYPYKNKKSDFLVFDENGKYLDADKDFIISYDNSYITLTEPLKIASTNYIIFSFPNISKTNDAKELSESNTSTSDITPSIDFNTIPEDDPLDYTGYYFDIYESIYSLNGYIKYSNGFDSYTLSKENFLLFGNSTFIHPSRYNLQSNTSLRMISTADRNHARWAHYSMVIPVNKTALDYYKSDYIKPNFKIIEIVTTERTNEIELPNLENSYDSFIMFRNSLILPIYDSDRFILDNVNHKFSIINEEDWIPANTTVTFIFLSSITNSDSKLYFVQNSFKCTSRYTKIPESLYRYPGQKFNKSKMLLYLNGTFVVPDRYRVSQNYIVLLDQDIDLSEEHTYTLVYLDHVDNAELDKITNIIDRTYDDDLDDIIFEEIWTKSV